MHTDHLPTEKKSLFKKPAERCRASPPVNVLPIEIPIFSRRSNKQNGRHRDRAPRYVNVLPDPSGWIEINEIRASATMVNVVELDPPVMH